MNSNTHCITSSFSITSHPHVIPTLQSMPEHIDTLKFAVRKAAGKVGQIDYVFRPDEVVIEYTALIPTVWSEQEFNEYLSSAFTASLPRYRLVD